MPSKKPVVSIIGIGLLGGSLALALRRTHDYRLTGWSPSASTREDARRFLRVAATLEDAVKDADVVILGCPSAQVVPLLRRILPLLKPQALVMDMASVKGAVAAGARRLQGANRHFIPCHPMAGREKSGVRFADAELYRGRRVVLTPLPGTPRALRSRAFALWRKTGAVLCVMGARVHDSRVAITSHLPHLLACALTESFGEALRKDPGVRLVVGTGFLDVTRIAASSPAMWSDIVALNAPEIRRRLSALRRRLASLERSLGPGRSSRWGRFFARTKAVREGLS